MTLRTLSDLESRLILDLEWREQALLTLQDVVTILGCSYAHARKLVHQLVTKRWLERVGPGKYQLIPADRGLLAIPDMNPLLAGSVLVASYYYAYATANHFHGLSTQAPATVYLATPQVKALTEIRGVEYRCVTLPPNKFFGYQKARVYTADVMMAEPEKAVVDSLDKMAYVGGIAGVAQVVHVALQRATRRDRPNPPPSGAPGLDPQRLADYAARMASHALVQRLGYLWERLGGVWAPEVEATLQAGLGQAKTYLGPTRQWGTGGEYNPRWRVVVNVPEHVLLGEIRQA